MSGNLSTAVVRECWFDCFPNPNARLLHSFSDVERRYAEPHRHYHTMSHIREVLLAVSVAVRPPNPSPELMLAAILHDVVYDPRAADNEERSAQYARELLASLQVPRERREETARLILLTKQHDPAPGDESGKALIDADLAILGADTTRYDAYAEAIREEYAWVPEDQYRQGRRRVLERFLARIDIYRTAWMKPREPLARANLAREIASLS